MALLQRLVACLGLLTIGCGFESAFPPGEPGRDGIGDSDDSGGPTEQPFSGRNADLMPALPDPGTRAPMMPARTPARPTREPAQAGTGPGPVVIPDHPVPEDATPADPAPMDDAANDGPSVDRAPWESICDRPGARDAFTPRDGETCWEFRIHNESSPTDTSPFEALTGESIHELFYAVPWAPGSVMTRTRTAFDSEAMYLQTTYSSHANRAPGDVNRNSLGTTLGTDAELLALAGPGGCNQELPDDVGLQLPDDGLIMVEWHVYNDTGEAHWDTSSLHICTAPRESREHIAGWTLLGTENFGSVRGLEPGEQEVSSACHNYSGRPITLLWLTPQMRSYGRHMVTELRLPEGAPHPILDIAYDTDRQVTYAMSPRIDVPPEADLITTCGYDITREGGIGFGVSASQERCYQLAMSYPAGALANGVPSLIGVQNTCW